MCEEEAPVDGTEEGPPPDKGYVDFIWAMMQNDITVNRILAKEENDGV